MLEVMAPFSTRDSVLERGVPTRDKPGTDGGFGMPGAGTFSNLNERFTTSPTMIVSRSSEAANWAAADPINCAKAKLMTKNNHSLFDAFLAKTYGGALCRLPR